VETHFRFPLQPQLHGGSVIWTGASIDSFPGAKLLTGMIEESAPNRVPQ
jgi:hypothetical protein